DLVLLAHGNGGIDLAPALSVRARAALLAECLTLEWLGDGRLAARRAVYGGKIHARVVTRKAGRVVATLRSGAFGAAPPPEGAAGTIHAQAVPDDIASKRRTVGTVEPEAGDVDITQAEILVAVGRGIEDEENLEIVEALAKALGGEVACSRPVVDKGWLPKSRQVGTSGLTVKPRVYVAVGISGSFQHLGGIKGSPYLVAINKDPRAPIFGVADVGIVGDLFDVVPALEEKVREAKG
ncbi:MAG: electron transfer flavoprotein subunit alpha/FixB family protein, partial [Planctomycetota bacterium]